MTSLEITKIPSFYLIVKNSVLNPSEIMGIEIAHCGLGGILYTLSFVLRKKHHPPLKNLM